MAVTAVTITCNRYTLQHWSVTSPFAKTPQKQTNNKRQKKNTNPSLTPPRPSPTPIHSLNICQLIQNISFAFSLKPVILITQGGREGRKEGGGAREGGGDFFFKKCIDANSVCTRSISPPPHQMKANFKNKQIWSKLTWFEWLHSENDIWFTYRWGYNTHTRTHRLPHKLIYT